ncbi:MAG: cation:proton antiporter [Chloroflexota bacterium]|nr:cation:proton antiporter [Chloroflexota bacterium]
MPDLLTGFALIAIVLTIAALTSGVVERAPLSFPMIFLGLGILLGERGLGLLTVDPHDPTLEVIAILSLALVLFIDAVNLELRGIGDGWVVPALALGPGTLLTISIIALAASWLLDTTLVQSVLLGAILSSTDPVVLRDVVRDERIPRSVRRALRIEAGTNDIVVLPILLILIAIAQAEAGGAGEWLLFFVQLFVLGTLAGFAVGGIGAWLMEKVDARIPIRREYQALYGVGLVLLAFVAGDAVGGDGFLAAFAAGAAVTILNRELCTCFLEYGEVTAEMAMLLSFILFGAVLSTLVPTVPLVPSLILAGIAILIARPVAFGLVLRKANVSPVARVFISWFGPRGLNSLLFALLLVRDGVAGAERLLAIVGIVVGVSVVAHGASAAPLSAWYARRTRAGTLAEERESSAAGLFQGASDEEIRRITPDELAALLGSPDPPVVVDVRSRSEYEQDEARIPGSVRVLPDEVAEWAAGQSRERLVVAYCT